MKICQITHGRVNPDGENGITRTVYSLNKYLNKRGVTCEIFSFNDNQERVEDFKRDEDTSIKLFPRTKYFKNKDFCDYILSDQFDFNIVHFHLMWMIDKNSILTALKKKAIPYIITVHGAYAPNLINSLKKKISMKTFEKNYLNNAKALHALCYEEKHYLRNLGLSLPIFVIPNGINETETSKIEKSFKLDSPYNKNFINIVWVGRIREDKNVIGIVKSLLHLSEALRNKIKIHIIGNGIESYISKVKKIINENNLEKFIVLHGPKYKEEKYQFIIHSDIYLQPSFSEGISFSIIDAMACGKPMILSRQTNMTYYYNQDFYIMTEPFPEDIAFGITHLVENKNKRKLLGENSKKMIETVFNWDVLIEEYIKMYKTMLNE